MPDTFLYSPRANENTLNLRRTLSALEYERRLKLRELDLKKKKFLHEHRRTSIQHNVVNEMNPEENAQGKLNAQKEKERQSTLELKNRSTNFIQGLRVKPLSSLIKMEPEQSQEERKTSHPVPEGSTNQSLHNKVIALYQKSVSGVLHRERERHTNSFMQSVSTILGKLKDAGEDEDSKKDVMSNLTRKIFHKFAGLNNCGTDTISEESECNLPADSPESAQTCGDEKDGNKQELQTIKDEQSEKEADNYLASEMHSSKALQLWARVRKEQKSVNLLTRGEEPKSSDDVQPLFNARGTGETPRASTKHRQSSSKRLNRSGRDNIKGESPVRSISPKADSVSSPHKYKKSENPIRTRSARISKPVKSNGTRYGGRQKKESSCNCPTISIEDCTATKCSPQTVIVVHDDDDDDNTAKKPIQWDQSHRYSLTDADINDGDGGDDDDHSGDNDDDGSKQNSSDEEETPAPCKDNSKCNDSISQVDEIISPEPSTDREELQPSPFSLCSGSELTLGTRSQNTSRMDYKAKQGRRVSLQTSGNLRALTSVLNEESKQSEIREAGTSYDEMVHTLKGIANSVEEQARRLENVRRAGPSMPRRESLSTSMNSQGNAGPKRRKSIASPDRKNPAFVTNEVYKFLERRTSSKLQTRRPTLSKLELRLLSQASGEDTVGRRSSFSENGRNRRQSIDIVPTMSPTKESKAGSFTDISNNFLDNNRSKSSRRHSTGAFSDRIASTPTSSSRLSNISEHDSTNGANVGKTVRSFSWAPDTSVTSDWHVLAMELMSKCNNRPSISKFRSTNHMLKWFGEEYRRQAASMMYEELRYCTYLRLAPHQVPDALNDTNLTGIFTPED